MSADVTEVVAGEEGYGTSSYFDYHKRLCGMACLSDGKGNDWSTYFLNVERESEDRACE